MKHLNMIGHGTTGADGIEEGIHLRWAFNDKPGFPDCFKLYRRESDLRHKYEFHIGQLPLGKLPLPFTERLQLNTDFSFTLASAVIKGQEAEAIDVEKETLPDHSIIALIRVPDELTIVFSEPVARIELSFFISNHSAFQIIAHSEEGDYDPHTVSEASAGIKNISFDAPGTKGIVLSGQEINLAGLAVWICGPSGGWKRINDFCGCGLPVNQEGTSYTDEVYPFMGKDLAMALCRLGYRRLEDSPITAAEFIELKAMLLTMEAEGSEVPVGWTFFPDEEEDLDATLAFSKYDFLLAQSLHVFFAKILGLYHVDTDADDDTYYDYKVTAEWPEWTKRRLDQEILFDDYETGETFFPIRQLDDHVVLLGTTSPQIVEESYLFFRAESGIEVSSQNLPVVISFLKPVTEVQLVLVNRDFIAGNPIITVEAYKNLYSAYVDREELLVERGMVRLRAEKIDSIKIYAARVVICRIHYDFEPYPVGLQDYIVCGLKKQNHLSLTKPTGLKASFMPGGTITDQDGNVSEKPYLAGLRWEVNEDPETNLISIAPVLYHLERQPEAGPIELVTEDAPLFVSPSVIENRKSDIPIGWPEERQYYTEAVTQDTVNNYRVAAIDLFGRQSAFTEFVTYEIANPKPPHPIDVAAKFLDYSTYQVADDSFIGFPHQNHPVRISFR